MANLTHGKQHVLLHAYSSMIADSNPYESDYAECASLYLAAGGNPGEKCIARILSNASEYMSAQFSSIQQPTPPLTPSSSFQNRPRGSSKRSLYGSTDTMAPYIPTFIDANSNETDEPTMTYNMSEDNTVLNVYAEGTSIHIGTSNAASGCGVYAKYILADYSVKEWKKTFLLSREEPASNQRSELRAFYAALDAVQRIKDANPHINTFNVHISSKYAQTCATEWGKTWAANRWKRAEGPIKNVDIIRPLYEKLESMPFVNVTVIQRDKKKDAEIPQGSTIARELALSTLHKTA
jgi:ribonuclease HI